MPSRQASRTKETKKKTTSRRTAASSMALVPLQREDARRESGQPGGGQGRTDVVGIIPAGQVHIDPDITEGHAGYEESGSSEVIPLKQLESLVASSPTKRLARSKTTAKGKRRTKTARSRAR
jgi:hypothetical protein